MNSVACGHEFEPSTLKIQHYHFLINTFSACSRATKTEYNLLAVVYEKSMNNTLRHQL